MLLLTLLPVVSTPSLSSSPVAYTQTSVSAVSVNRKRSESEAGLMRPGVEEPSVTIVGVATVSLWSVVVPVDMYDQGPSSPLSARTCKS